MSCGHCRIWRSRRTPPPAGFPQTPDTWSGVGQPASCCCSRRSFSSSSCWVAPRRVAHHPRSAPGTLPFRSVDVQRRTQPVSLMDGEFSSLYSVSSSSFKHLWLSGLTPCLGVQDALEYLATVALRCTSAPGPFGDGGRTRHMASGADGWVCSKCTPLTVAFLSSLYRCSQRSCQPQPRESRREAAFRKDR